MKQIFAWLFAAIFFAAGCAQSPDLAEPVRGGGYENADGLVIVAACPPATRTETRSLASKEMWAKAVKVSGIDMKRFSTALSDGKSDVQIKFAARKTLQYALRATPSVGVGGKYILTPDDVMGDQSMFFNILNGLTSEIL